MIVPTLNAGPGWAAWWRALEAQSMPLQRVLVLDSGSTDGTVQTAQDYGATIRTIPQGEFNHGGTRALAATLASDADILVYLTQDAILATPDSLAHLVAAFDDATVGAAYGRQLPRPGAGAIERHGRGFIYPDRSHRVTADAAGRWGIKGPFLSDSYTAYRTVALRRCGGFPQRAIVSEDMYVGGRLLGDGWSLAYVAEAAVVHSHAYSLAGELRRYFDIGVFYSEQPWLLRKFGSSGAEGLRFVRSEFAYLLRHAPWRIPESWLRTLCKFAGFRLGQQQRRLPRWLRLACSGQKYYWAAPDPDG